MVTFESLMQLLRDTLPTADLYSAPAGTLEDYVKHGLFLRRELCRDLPEDMFLQFVFYPRVNSENLEPCRSFFYGELAPRLEGLSPVEAVLEVNRWCCENMTYEPSDDRTESPMTAYRSGLGRCGEESVFAVSALRAAGIPARQVYVPWWVHCDDNHAWVEVFVDGDWHFLGACEPEPILDRGWFVDASSRAPLVHYCTFYPCARDPFLGREGCSYLYNVTGRYAPTAKVEIAVFHKDGSPASGAEVAVSVLNMAGFRPISIGTADAWGRYTLETGLVPLHLEALGGELEFTVSGDCQCALTEGQALGARDWDVVPPGVWPGNRTTLSDAQAAENAALLLKCKAIREKKHWAGETEAFLQSLSPADRPLGRKMLEAMSKKDLKDTSAEVLRHHFTAALPYKDLTDFEDILNPRIGFEMLGLWRNLADRFSEDEKNRFRENPEAIWGYITEHFPDGDGRYYPSLPMPPMASVRAGCTDEAGRYILAVALLRSMGISARLSPVDGKAEYRRGCPLVPCPGYGSLKLHGNGVYGTHYTLSRLEHGRYITLGTPSEVLPVGQYRLITANRLPNGVQLAQITPFVIYQGETTTLSLALREAAPEQMLGNAELGAFTLADGTASPELLQGKTLLCWLEPGAEPTEHILNELHAVRNRLPKDLRLIFILRPGTALPNPLPADRIANDDFRTAADTLARRLFLEPGVWPLLILTDETHRGYYGTCGYQVGTAELLLKLFACI